MPAPTETDEMVIDATVVDDHPHDSTSSSASTEIARRERRSEVIRPLDPDQLIQSFTDYQQLLPRLLSDSDYQDAGRGRRFVKKSGWRKIATAFDLDVQIIRSTVDRDDTGQPLRAEVWARAIAPSGRSMDGDGYCSGEEDRFSGPRGNRSKLENDLRATATTRAMNRAISGLVGMGEVSAEEIDAGPPARAQLPAWAVEATRPRKEAFLDLLEPLLGRPAARHLAVDVKASLGYLPDGFVMLAGAIAKRMLEDNAPPDAPAPGPDDEADAAIAAAASAEGPTPGSVEIGDLPSDPAEATGVLKAAGCICTEPLDAGLGAGLADAACPISGHGVPF